MKVIQKFETVRLNLPGAAHRMPTWPAVGRRGHPVPESYRISQISYLIQSFLWRMYQEQPTDVRSATFPLLRSFLCHTERVKGLHLLY